MAQEVLDGPEVARGGERPGGERAPEDVGRERVPGLGAAPERQAVAAHLGRADRPARHGHQDVVGGRGDLAADGEPVPQGGVGDGDERDDADLAALAGEPEREPVGPLDDGLGAEPERLGAAEPALPHERQGDAAAGGREQAHERALAGPPALGGDVGLAGARDVLPEQDEHALELDVGEHLVGLALAVEVGEVERVEGVGGDGLDGAQEAVERADGGDPSADGPGAVVGREPGEVELGVAAGDVGVAEPPAREEGGEVPEVGAVGPLGVPASGLGVARPPGEHLDGLTQRRLGRRRMRRRRGLGGGPAARLPRGGEGGRGDGRGWGHGTGRQRDGGPMSLAGHN